MIYHFHFIIFFSKFYYIFSKLISERLKFHGKFTSLEDDSKLFCGLKTIIEEQLIPNSSSNNQVRVHTVACVTMVSLLPQNLAYDYFSKINERIHERNFNHDIYLALTILNNQKGLR